MAQIRFGVTYPEKEDFSDLPVYARRVEELGFDAIWVTENISSNSPSLECFVALSFMAAHTKRIAIGTSVILLPLRNPVLVGQMVNSLDVLSGGRMVLGVGIGGGGPDFVAYGGDSRERGARADESLDILKRLWTRDPVTYDGKFFHLKDYVLLPRPRQRPHPSIHVGGSAEAVLRRAGRFGNTLIPVSETPERVAELYRKAKNYSREYGRSPGDLSLAVHLYTCLAKSRQESARVSSRVLSQRYQYPTSPAPDGPCIFGTPAQARQKVQAYVDVGVTEFVFNMTCGPEEALSQVEKLANEVVPHWR